MLFAKARMPIESVNMLEYEMPEVGLNTAIVNRVRDSNICLLEECKCFETGFGVEYSRERYSADRHGQCHEHATSEKIETVE